MLNALAYKSYAQVNRQQLGAKGSRTHRIRILRLPQRIRHCIVQVPLQYSRHLSNTRCVNVRDKIRVGSGELLLRDGDVPVGEGLDDVDGVH